VAIGNADNVSTTQDAQNGMRKTNKVFGCSDYRSHSFFHIDCTVSNSTAVIFAIFKLKSDITDRKDLAIQSGSF